MLRFRSFQQEDRALSFEDSTSFSAPSAFGPFRVLHQIGTGALGPVFRTYDPQRDRLIAVKAFKLDLVPEDVARLAESLRRLAPSLPSDPAIVTVVDAGLEGTTAYVAMEYVTAETLDVALRHLAPAPLAVAVHIVEQLAHAIDTAWASGLGHGALHPRDVFVAPGSNDVQVTGFGIVPALERVGVRTPVRRPYAAPERTERGPDSWTVRADVYSLGAITHELLTRRRPAGAGEQDGALAPGMTPEQRVLVRRVLAVALADRPDDRFTSATAFAEALAAVAHGQVPANLPEPPVVAAPAPTPPAPEPRQPEFAEIAAVPEPVVDVAPVIAPPPEPKPVVQPPVIAAPIAAAPSRTVASEPAHADRSDRAPSSSKPGPVWREEPVVPARPEPTVVPTLLSSEPVVIPDSRPYPWAAIVMAVVAGLAAGGVGGYSLGVRSGRSDSTSKAAVRPAPGDTEVTLGSKASSDVPPGIVASVPPTPDPASAAPKSAGAQPPEAVATPGQILVHAVPAGATVSINGRGVGPAPQTIKDLALGSYTIKVSRSGYVTQSEQVSLTKGSPWRDVTLRLPPASTQAPEPEPGSIFVDSRPRGARVFLDSKPVGLTPFLITSASAGAHVVRIEMAGYRTVVSKATVKNGERTPVTVTLERKPGYDQKPR